MKKLMTILLLSLLLVTEAQNTSKGDFSVLGKQNNINLVMDFTKASIMEQNETTFAKNNTEWNKNEVILLCVNSMNKQLKEKLVVGNYGTSTMTLKIIVLSVNKNGAFACNVMLLDNGKTIAEIKGLKSTYGDLIGTNVHRIKVGSQKLGTKLGRFIYNKIRYTKY